MSDQETLTFALSVVVKPEPSVSAEDKEGIIRGQIVDQVASLARNFDWGIAVTGTLESTAAETVTFNDVQPDYVE